MGPSRDQGPPAHAFRIRPATPEDWEPVAEELALWMPAPKVELLLPRTDLQRHTDTSLVAHTGQGDLAGFLIAFESTEHPGVAYIHFVWVSPEHRGHGLGRALYERIFGVLRARGCHLLEAVTSPRNAGAMGFHASLGFDRDVAVEEADVHPEPGLVVFTRTL